MAAKSRRTDSISHLEPFSEDEEEQLNVIIETPKGSRNKFSYDEEMNLFKLGGMLPSGAVFPFDFGFVPSTLGGDGDPLDVLLLMDEPAFAGCLVHARLIGVIEASQTEREGETTRNDRLIAVAAASRTHAHVRALTDLNDNLVDEIEHFFVSYNTIKGKQFEPLGRFGPQRAAEIVRQGIERFRQEQDGKASGRTRTVKHPGRKNRAAEKTASTKKRASRKKSMSTKKNASRKAS